MPIEMPPGRIASIARAKDDFRFFDDLYPPLRQMLREAHYRWPSVEAMNEQHRQRGTPPEEIAEELRRKDQTRFDQVMSYMFRTGRFLEKARSE